MEQTAPVSECRGECQGHQNYKNYPTFTVAVWFDNNQLLQEYLRGLARTALTEAPELEAVQAGDWTREEGAKFALADQLKGKYERQADELTETGTPMNSLLSWAVDIVDWDGIAEGLIDTMKEEDEHV